MFRVGIDISVDESPEFAARYPKGIRMTGPAAFTVTPAALKELRQRIDRANAEAAEKVGA